MLGHIIPAIGLGKELKSAGHKVFFLANKMHESLILKADLNFVETGWDKFPSRFIMEFTNELIETLREIKVDLVICDSAQAPAAFAAEKNAIPWVSFQTTVPLPDSSLPGKSKVNERLRVLYGQNLDKVREHFQLKPLKNSIRTRGDLVGLSPYLHLLMVHEKLVDREAYLPPNTKIVGFCSYTSTVNIRELDHLPNATNLLVCTTSLTRTEYLEITENYLEDIFESFGDDDEFNIVVTAPPEYKEKNSHKKNITWLHEIPIHDSIMPSIDIVISHGGTSTIQRMMRYGKPGVIIPLGDDQPTLTERFSKLGSIKVMYPSEINKTSIKQSVNELIRNKEFQTQALNLANHLKQNDPNEMASKEVELFLKKIESGE